MDINRVFYEIKNKIMEELRCFCPMITPVNNVGFKLDYTLYWNGGFSEYARFSIKEDKYCSKKVTLIQEVVFCTHNELMSMNMVAEEMTNEVMKSYGGNRFCFNTSVVKCTEECNDEVSEDEG